MVKYNTLLAKYSILLAKYSTLCSLEILHLKLSKIKLVFFTATQTLDGLRYVFIDQSSTATGGPRTILKLLAKYSTLWESIAPYGQSIAI